MPCVVAVGSPNWEPRPGRSQPRHIEDIEGLPWLSRLHDHPVLTLSRRFQKHGDQWNSLSISPFSSIFLFFCGPSKDTMAYVPDSFLLEHGLRRGHLFAPVKSNLCAKESKQKSWQEKSWKLGQQMVDYRWLRFNNFNSFCMGKYEDRCTCPYMCNTNLSTLYIYMFVNTLK